MHYVIIALPVATMSDVDVNGVISSPCHLELRTQSGKVIRRTQKRKVTRRTRSAR